MAHFDSGKVLLVNYAGYWLTANTFVPDCSLATLAGTLARAGIAAEIVDFHQPSMMGEVMPPESEEASTRLLSALRKGELPDERTLDEYHSFRLEGQRRLEERKTRELLARIEGEDVSVVCFKIWIGNGVMGSVRIAKEIRKRFPRVRLVAGGPAIQGLKSAFPKYTDVFDLLVYGEGEQALLDFVARGAGAEFRNSIVRRDGAFLETPVNMVRALDELALPDYSRETYPGVESLLRMRIIDDSRGCFNHCSFCTHPNISGLGSRKKSPQRVVDEIERAHLEDGISYFRFAGSNPPLKFLVAVAEEILRRGLKICYSAFSSMNNSDVRAFPVLAESGLRALLYGIETGDPEFLKRVHRKNNRDHDHIVSVCQEGMKNGIFMALSVIVPSPFETQETKDATLRLLARIFKEHRHGSVFVSPAFLIPGTEWWHRMKDFGFEFAPGFDAESYLLGLLHWDSNFLLPRSCARDLGVLMNGKSFSQMAVESEAFCREIEKMGLPTNVDDAAYMLSLMSHLSPASYKATMRDSLVLGGKERLESVVRELNRPSVVS